MADYAMGIAIYFKCDHPDDLNRIVNDLIAEIKKLPNIDDVEHTEGPDELADGPDE